MLTWLKGMGRKGLASWPAPLTLLLQLPRVSPALTLALVVTLAAGAALPVAFITATGGIVGVLASAAEWGLTDGEQLTLALFVGAAGGSFILQQVVGPLRWLAAELLGMRLDASVGEAILDATTAPPGIEHLERPHLQDEITRATAVATGVPPSAALSGIVRAAAMRLEGLGGALLLLPFSPLLTVVLVAGALASSRLFMWTFAVAQGAADRQASGARALRYYTSLTMEAHGAKEVRVWGLLPWLVRRYEATWLKRMEAIRHARRRGLLASAGGYLLFDLTQLLAMAHVAMAGAGQQISAGEAAVYLQAIIALMDYLGSSADDASIVHGSAPLPRALGLRRTIEHLAQVSPSGLRRSTRQARGRPREAIRFDRVTFAYAGATRPVLQALDLTIPAGRAVAIVGPNGAGKTTLVKLLCGLYAPTSGRVLVDGIDLHQLEPACWRRRLAVLFQDFLRYELTVRENIGFGAVQAMADHDLLRTAAGQAGAAPLIARLPRGWETVLSSGVRGGVDLSGGEWQRIALARALFAARAGAGLLILDEPAASLDVRAEAELYGRFLELTSGLTTVLISHRFSTVRRAELIYVLQDGRVAECGGHDDLLRLGGVYASMYAAQADRYRSD